MSSNTNNSNTTTKKPFTTTTTCTTVIKPIEDGDARELLKDSAAKQNLQQPGLPQPTPSGIIPRRAPIEEASIPQPRSPPLRDTLHEPTLMTQMSDKLSRAMHTVKESAEEVADKIKVTVVGAAHKADQVLETTASKVEGTVKRVGDKADQVLENAATKVEGTVKRAGDKVERTGESAKKRVEELGDRARDQLRDKAHDWEAEEKSLRERVMRDIMARRERERIERTDEHGSEHQGTWDSIKDWFRGNHHDSTEHSVGSHDDFDEGADMAKREAFKRLDRLAKDTEKKIDDARRAADQWERGAKEQVGDAWENARTHSMHIARQQRGSGLPVGSLAQTLKAVKDENKRLQQTYMRDVCDSHSNRAQCYDTVKKLLGLAKENARIKVALEDKHIKTH